MADFSNLKINESVQQEMKIERIQRQNSTIENQQICEQCAIIEWETIPKFANF